MEYFEGHMDFFNDSDIVFGFDPIGLKKKDKAFEFFFDDEPLESILYSHPSQGPTPANLYLTAQDDMKEIFASFEDDNIQTMIQKASELAMSGHKISMGMCYEILVIMKHIIPDFTNALIKFDLSPLQLLLEMIWKQSLEVKDEKLQKGSGTLLYRWYEHHCKYQEARQVLKKLLEIHREEGNRIQEAILVNNLAFEYWLEGKPADAIPYFEEAAKIFKEEDDSFNCSNSRVNYLMCKSSLCQLEDNEEIENELREHAQTLSSSGRWHERKPWILLAKIEERRGNIEEAINLVKKAIESSKNSNTRYPEQDREYLNHLLSEKKLG
jgi:tetratricopeptide (TPR) repeat protein